MRAARPQSMTRRLILWLTGATTVFWLVAAGLGIAVMKEEFGEIFDASLQETAERLLPLVTEDMKRHGESVSAEERGGEYLVYQLRSADGSVLFRSKGAPAAPFAAPLKRGFSQDGDYRFYTVKTRDGSLFLQVADAWDNRDEATDEGGMALFLPVLLLIPVSSGLIWLIVRRMLAPIDAFRQAIEEKDGGNMAPLASKGLPGELEPIARSVNHLLARLQAAFDAEREFTANSAHELRTPIAGALAQTQMLMIGLEGPEKRRAEQIETSLVNLRHTTEKLLQLARAEAGIGVAGTRADLARVLELVLTDFQRGEMAVRIAYEREPGAVLEGAYSEDAFAIVLRNLIENALLHGQPGEPVSVRLQKGGIVRIVNAAPRLSPDELIAIRKRFGRGNAIARGSGLGLSIAERLLQQMHVRFDILSPATGRSDGLEVVMRF
ncbi:histidine kinase dimerization/phospho-acceptor domain-containing protein [Pararhizobium gei]|uniref:histidine kinase dimerization/phospho-acceptor domain-containing protein n=1 Tax=Pararhizobium gei TaxID=1395951 RepID=UPI0023DC33D3|nr:histidine kinase dimerization/phospho-acceptor domain-containing protein [Rhizobium gei]